MSICTKWVDRGTIECKSWANELSATCTSWADDGSSQCSQWADQGYNACQQWADEGYNACCDWWPCSWFCDALVWISNVVCKGWVWVSNVVCKGWYWVSNVVCQVWYWLAKWVCKAWAFIVKVVCTLWSWVAKLVCVVWGNLVCAVASLARTALRTFSSKAQRRARIKHVFVLMLENRAFDHMLGFSDLQGVDAVTGLPTHAEDLLGNPHSNTDPANPGVPVQAITPTEFKITKISNHNTDPNHEFAGTLMQLSGVGAIYPDPVIGTYPPIDNSGFIASYRANPGSSDPGSPQPEKIMRCFSSDQLPVLNTLAQEFAICDHWFASIPGPTWPNRFFIHAASSGGLDDSPSGFDSATSELVDGYRFNNGTLFDSLESACLDWKIFEGDELPQSFAISGMNLYALEGHFKDFEDFNGELVESDFSPSYIFIEPNYGNVLPTTSEDFTCGTSQHPLDDVTRGERLIKEVYEAIRNSPHWETSVLLITYDEHGGFYDHVTPPRTTPPGDGISDADNNHHNFDFAQLGVRVPAIVVSPLIPRATIDHTVYDHTSLVRTVEDIFQLGTLTDRDATANTLHHLFSLSVPRTDAPNFLPDPAESGFRCEDDPMRISELRRVDEETVKRQKPVRGEASNSIWGFAHVALLKHLSLIPRQKRKERKRVIESFLAIQNEYQARVYLHEVRQLVRSEKRLLEKRRPQRMTGQE